MLNSMFLIHKYILINSKAKPRAIGKKKIIFLQRIMTSIKMYMFIKK